MGIVAFVAPAPGLFQVALVEFTHDFLVQRKQRYKCRTTLLGAALRLDQPLLLQQSWRLYNLLFTAALFTTDVFL